MIHRFDHSSQQNVPGSRRTFASLLIILVMLVIQQKHVEKNRAISESSNEASTVEVVSIRVLGRG